MFITASKTALLILSTMFPTDPTIIVSGSMATSLFLLLLTAIWTSIGPLKFRKPCSVPAINIFRSFSYSVAIISSIAALLANRLPSIVSAIFMYSLILGGVFICAVGFGAWYFLFRTRWRKAQPFSEEGDELVEFTPINEEEK
jgi:hypothetical protein